MWLTGEGGDFDGAVVRIDPRTGRVESIILGARRFGTAMAVTSDGVWIGGADIFPQRRPEETLARWVFKIDPHRNVVVRSIRLDATTVIALARAGRAFWATGWGAVVKLSSTGRVLLQRRMDGAGWSIAPAPGGPWVARPFVGTRSSRQAFPARQLLRVRPSDPRSTIVELNEQPGGVAVAGGAAWTVVGDWRGRERAVVRVDASGGTTEVATPGLPGLIAGSPDALWVVAQEPHRLSKIC